VIWDFAGRAIPTERVGAVARLAEDPPEGLAGLIDDEEVAALVARAAALVRGPVFPDPQSGRSYPWPLV